VLFTERLNDALQRLHGSDAGLAIFLIDLDRFKVVNDSLGHARGDLLLIQAARRLATYLRPDDMLARFGGDEFAILVEEVTIDAAGSLAERLLSALQEPFHVNGHDVFIGGSIGVVLASTSNQVATRLLRAADVAMYEAKGAGRGRWVLYDERIGDRAAQRLALESQLRHAIEQRQIEVHYQPIIDLATGRIHGFEALARWRHPERGLLSPAAFIAIAEETGLIAQLGDWVLEEACRQAAAWSQMLPADPPLIAVNVSPRQIRSPRFPHTLRRVLGETGLPPLLLELEVTEEVLAGDDSVPNGFLRTLTELGIRLAMDDFGVGYSSLSRMRRLPLQTLKVDRSFVAGLGVDHHATAIVRAVAALARELGIRVTAEGIETREQRRLAAELGCVFGQGFLFAGPLDSDQATTFLLSAAGVAQSPGRASGSS
jgi:diguanylate cyclase (GGDEF)-like protein